MRIASCPSTQDVTLMLTLSPYVVAGGCGVKGIQDGWLECS